MKQNNKKLKILSCSVFTLLYVIVSVISLICSTSFFDLAHSGIMSWVLAIGFELGAMSCLLSTLILPKKKLGLVWFMFVVLTLFQCMGNMYAAFINLKDYSDWILMFALDEMEPIAQKRVLAAISGIILPLVALGFIRIMANILQDGKTIDINDYEEEDETPAPTLFTQMEEPKEETDEKQTVEESTVHENIVDKNVVTEEDDDKKKNDGRVEEQTQEESKTEVQEETSNIFSNNPTDDTIQKEEVIEKKVESPVVETPTETKPVIVEDKKEEKTKETPVAKQAEPTKPQMEVKQSPKPKVGQKQKEVNVVKKKTGRVWNNNLNGEVG